MFSVLPTIEKEYLINSLHNGIRLDNRKLDCFRNIYVEKLYENGQIKASIGNTIVMTNIQCSLFTPPSDKSDKGSLQFNIDASHLRHSGESNNSNEEISELRNRLNNLLEKSLKDSQ